MARPTPQGRTDRPVVRAMIARTVASMRSTWLQHSRSRLVPRSPCCTRCDSAVPAQLREGQPGTQPGEALAKRRLCQDPRSRRQLVDALMRMPRCEETYSSEAAAIHGDEAGLQAVTVLSSHVRSPGAERGSSA